MACCCKMRNRQPVPSQVLSITKDPVDSKDRTEGRQCRICFEETSEPAISTCRCKGTIGLVHMSCLEKWLAISNTHTCELCSYSYLTIRTPKYKVCESLYHWGFVDHDPLFHRGLRSDIIVFFTLTPMSYFGIYACMVAADFYTQDPFRSSPASHWTTLSLLIMVILLTFAYYLWVAVTIRYHGKVWYTWWQSQNTVRLVPRDPHSSSLEHVATAPMAEVDECSANQPGTSRTLEAPLLVGSFPVIQ